MPSFSRVATTVFACTLVFSLIFPNLISAQEKPVTLVLKESFGSDPYDHLAYHDGLLLVSGMRESARNNAGSRNIDILRYSDTGFELIGQHHFNAAQNGQQLLDILDLDYFNGHWVVLLRGALNYQLVTATVENGQLSVVSEETLSNATLSVQLVAGHDNNMYLIDRGAGLQVTAVQVDADGSITQGTVVEFGVTPNEPGLQEYFSVSYDNQALYLISNQDDTAAAFYRLPLAEDGEPLDAVELTFADAQSTYPVSRVSGDLWLLTYRNFGFQVAQLVDNNLTVVFEFNQNSSYNAIAVRDNLVFGIDTFREVDVFEIGTDSNVTYRSSVQTKGFLKDFALSADTLFVSRDWNGIEAFDIAGTTLTSQHEYNQSGDVTDLSLQGSELALSALESNLHFWSLSSDDSASLSGTYQPLNNMMGVEWAGSQMLVSHSGQFERHLVDNLKNNVDVGEDLGSLEISGSDGQIVALDNGYLAQALRQLNFFDRDGVKQSSFELGDVSSATTGIQEPIAQGSLLFVPTLAPSQVIVYDTTDLTNVTELSRIDRFQSIRGNIAVNGSYLYIPIKANDGTQAVTIYDISDPTAPEELPTFTLPVSAHSAATLHIDEGYLLAINDRGTLFDLTDPRAPVLIEQHAGISTNGVGKGVAGEVFTVSRSSAGVINRSQINLAPDHPDTVLSMNEDTPATAALTPSDRENDPVIFDILTEPTLGSLTISDNNALTYQPAADQNGIDTASVLVSDIHGGARVFNVNVTISAVNDAPVIDTAPLSVAEDVQTTVLLAVTDVDSDTLTYSIVRAPEFGTAELSAEGLLTYQSALNFFGADSIEVEVSDDQGASDSATLAVRVQAVNDLPEFTAETEASGDEDTEIAIALSATDIEGDTVSFALANNPPGWSGDIAENTLTLTPAENDSGTFAVEVAMSDSETTVTQTLTVLLHPVNDAPVSADESISISVVSGQSRSTSLSVSDPDGDELTYEVTGKPSNGSASVNSGGSLTYTANANATGNDSLVVTASDPDGESVSVTVNVSVTAPPPPPAQQSGGGGSVQWLVLLGLAAMAVRRRLHSQQHLSFC